MADPPRKSGYLVGPALASPFGMVGTKVGCFAVLCLALAGTGCESKSEAPPAVLSCDTDTDCPAEQACARSSNDRLLMVFNPCFTQQQCSTGSCASGSVCAPYVPIAPHPSCPTMTCIPACTATSCPADQVCDASGLCAFKPCNEPDAPACGERYRCDPAAAMSPQPPTVQGSLVSDSLDPAREAQRGCVRRQCDEDDGFACKELWTCAPGTYPNEGSGCAPVPCTETGSCSSASFICEPGDGPHPTTKDVHGCVIRNCGEGYECQYLQAGTNYAYCDLDSPESDTYGCRVRSCLEAPEVCANKFTCDPGHESSSPVGCRPLQCHEPGGTPCPATAECVEVAGGRHDCVALPVANGGAAGGGASSGGAAGTAVTAGGAAVTGGRAAGGANAGGAPGQGAQAGSAQNAGRGGTNASAGSSSSPPANPPSGTCVPRQ